jgi:flagellar biosynthesis component FlhA
MGPSVPQIAAVYPAMQEDLTSRPGASTVRFVLRKLQNEEIPMEHVKTEMLALADYFENTRKLSTAQAAITMVALLAFLKVATTTAQNPTEIN